MNDGESASELSFDRLLETLVEKLAAELLRQPNRLYPRLLTIDRAVLYLGLPFGIVRHLTISERIPSMVVEGKIFIDRLDLDKWIDDTKTGKV